MEIVCRYPQFFAARLLKDSIVKSAKSGSGKGGTYFGATGCGKTYTMAFLATTMYDICLTVTAWCIIGLLGVLLIRSFGFREFHQEKIIPWLVGIAMIFFLIALMFN